eukprot:Phypoly_transcript_07231.p1 GENE.Phypoly_transcript_07231~~Phypoly_transcript_07231.p1  ORF type:complete len:483 (+),score=54.48 Phypoly_transcript_07231:159-1607(+)
MSEDKQQEVKGADPQSDTTQTNVVPKVYGGLEITNSEPETIYSVHSERKWVYLIVASIGCLQMPFSDTIYLPALASIQDHFHTTQGVVALSVALFMFMVGVSALVWGPASDYFGRVKVLYVGTVGYIAMNIVCLLAPSILILIIFRALQGAAVSVYLVVGSAIIADIFYPTERGFALGIFTIPMLVGPVLGPIIGGFMSGAKGWRSTFLLLIVLAVITAIGMIFFLRETHQYHTLRKVEKKNPTRAAAVQDYTQLKTPPVFISPLKSLQMSFYARFSPYIAVVAMQFGAFYACLTLFSPVMSAPPYSYADGIIGLLYIPSGVGSLIAAIVGGKLSDISGAKYKAPEARMLYTLILSMIFVIPGMQIYGWCMKEKTNLAGILVGHFILGFANAVYFPSVLAYLSSQKQSIAAAANSACLCWQFVAAGVATEVTVYIVDAIDFGYLAVLLNGVLFLAQVITLVIIIHKIRLAEAAPTKDAAARS